MHTPQRGLDTPPPPAGQLVLSHQTVYRFIYAQIRRTKDYSWRHCLPYAKSKRGWQEYEGGSPAALIRLRRPLTVRPAVATDRQFPEHREADPLLCRTYGQAVLALHERHWRLLLAVRPPGKAAAQVSRFHTPAEISRKQVLHFKCESTG